MRKAYFGYIVIANNEFMKINLSKLPFTDFLFLFFLAVVVGRFIFPFFLNPFDMIENDPGRHWYNGKNFFSSFIHPESAHILLATDPKMYQLYMAILGLLSKIIGSEKIIFTLASCFLCASLPWLWYKFMREFLSRKLSLFAAIIIGITPSMLNIYGYFMTETLLLNLMALSAWMALRAYRKKTLSSFAVAALCLLAASLTRVIALPISVIFITWLVLTLDEKLKRLSIVTAITALMIIPFGLQTYRIMHVFGPFGYPKMNAIYKISNNATFGFVFTDKNISPGDFGSPSFFNISPFAPFYNYKTERLYSPYLWYIDTRKGSEDWDAAYDYLREHFLTPEKVITELKENFIFFFFGHTWPDNDYAIMKAYENEMLTNIQIHWRYVWLPMTLVIILLSPFVTSSNYHRSFVSLTMLFIFLMLVQQTGVMEGRFRKPVEPFIIISFLIVISQASLAIGNVFKKKRKKLAPSNARRK